MLSLSKPAISHSDAARAHISPSGEARITRMSAVVLLLRAEHPPSEKDFSSCVFASLATSQTSKGSAPQLCDHAILPTPDMSCSLTPHKTRFWMGKKSSTRNG